MWYKNYNPSVFDGVALSFAFVATLVQIIIDFSPTLPIPQIYLLPPQ